MPKMKGISQPSKRALRRSCQTERSTTDYVINGTDVDILEYRRAQRLVSLLGLSECRARLIADLAWGGSA